MNEKNEEKKLADILNLLKKHEEIIKHPFFDVKHKSNYLDDKHCVNCGMCCIVPAIRKIELKDVVKICDKYKIDIKDFEKKYLSEHLPLSLKSPCSFLKKSKDGEYLCDVYDARPDLCVNFNKCAIIQNNPDNAEELIEGLRKEFSECDKQVCDKHAQEKE